MSTKKFEKAKRNALLLPTESKDTVAFTQDEHFTNVPDVVTEQYENTTMQAAAKKTWLGYSMANQYEVAQGDIDESYEVQAEQLQHYKDMGYSDRELEFLAASHSQDNFDVRMNRIEDDRKIDRQLNAAGAGGVLAQIGTGFADPLLLPSMLLSGGGAAMAKISTGKAIAVSALEGAAINGAMEYYMAKGDTQRDATDVMIALATGATLSGLVTAGSRKYADFRADVEDARVIDADNNNAIDGIIADREYNKVNDALEHGMPDPAQRKRYLSEKDIMDDLEAEVLSKQSGERMSARKVKKTKQEFREYRKMQKEKQARIASSNMRPSAKNKQIKQLQDAIDKREAVLNKKLYENKEAEAVRADLDALQQGVVPERLQARYKEMKAELGESDITVPLDKEVDTTSKAVQDAEMHKMPDVEVEGEAKSVGAAATDPLTLKYEMYGNLLPELDEGQVVSVIQDAEQLGNNAPRITRMATGAPLRSASSQVDTSMLSGIRGLGAKLLSNGVRTIKGHVPADRIADAILGKRKAHVTAYNYNRENWLKSQGISWYEWGKQAEAMRKFDKLTAKAQVVGSDNEFIAAGAKAKYTMNKVNLENNKAYGVIGYEKVNHRNDYVPVVYDYDNITELVSSGARPEHVVDVVKEAYMTGGIPLKEDHAITLAKAQIERAAKTKSGVNQAYRFGVTESDFKHVERAMLKEGIEPSAVRELRESIFTDDLKLSRSPRAMHSLRPNLMTSKHGIEFTDLIDTSINRNLQHLHETAGDCGLYSVGIKGRKQLEQVIDELDKRSQNQLLVEMAEHKEGSKAHNNLKKELDKIKKGEYREVIEGSVNLMYGRPAQDLGNDAAGDVLKSLRKATTMLRLKATGLTTVPEWGAAMVRTGGMRTLKAATGTRFLDLRKGSIAKDEFMTEFSKTLGATGHQDYLFGKYAYNNSDFDDVTKTKLGKIFDKFLGTGLDATMTANLFRTVQHGGEEAVARATVSALKDFSKGTRSKVIDSLRDIGGLSDEELSRMAKTLGKYDDIYEGIRMLDIQDQNKLASGVQSHIKSSFLAMHVGEQSVASHSDMGKVYTHLLNFAIGSYEKQLVRGIKHEKAALVAVTGSQFALALAAQSAYVYQKSLGMDGAERRAYLDKNLDDEALFWGALNKTGTLAAPMLMAQVAASFGLMPESVVASPTKAGISGFSGVPVVGMAQDIAKGSRAAVGQIKDTIFDEDNMEDDEAARDIKRILPIVETPLWNVTAGQILAED